MVWFGDGGGRRQIPGGEMGGDLVLAFVTGTSVVAHETGTDWGLALSMALCVLFRPVRFSFLKLFPLLLPSPFSTRRT